MNTNTCAEIITDIPKISNLNHDYRLEWQRIKFLIERDGLVTALEWCRQTMKIYRSAVLWHGDINQKPHHASTRGYKKTFILSYLDFKRFISQYG